MPLPDTAAKLPGYKGPYFGSLVHDFRDYVRANENETWIKQPYIQGRIREIEFRIDQIHQILLKVYRTQISSDIAKSVLGNVLTASINPISANARGQISPQDFNSIAARFGETSFDLNFYVESFYYFAWQLVLALRDLPSFARFEPRGVTRMRNKVLAHPADFIKSERFELTYRTDEPDAGPILKMGVATDDGWTDPGLFLNAHEFANSMREILNTGTRVNKDAR
ncbi:MAG: hypothetical protein SFV19_06180 [Rhodospirillaceae bacterium]|nr:hypothetical protein [Rhodospirillaceae bacterium]